MFRPYLFFSHLLAFVFLPCPLFSTNKRRLTMYFRVRNKVHNSYDFLYLAITKFDEEIVYYLQYFFLVIGTLINTTVLGSHNWAMFGQHLYSTFQSNNTWKNCPSDILPCIYMARHANGIRFSAKGQY